MNRPTKVILILVSTQSIFVGKQVNVQHFSPYLFFYLFFFFFFFMFHQILSEMTNSKDPDQTAPSV